MTEPRHRHGFDRAQLKTAAAKRLRQTMTACERALWHALRAKRFAPMRIRRQQPIGPYVADFYCAAAKLIVELDGSQHFTPEAAEYDAARTRWLEARGYRVIRFSNLDVLTNLDGVLAGIWHALEHPRSAPPSP